MSKKAESIGHRAWRRKRDGRDMKSGETEIRDRRTEGSRQKTEVSDQTSKVSGKADL